MLLYHLLCVRLGYDVSYSSTFDYRHTLHILGYSLTDLIPQKITVRTAPTLDRITAQATHCQHTDGMLVLCSSVCAIAFARASIRESLSDLETKLRPQQHTIDFRNHSFCTSLIPWVCKQCVTLSLSMFPIIRAALLLTTQLRLLVWLCCTLYSLFHQDLHLRLVLAFVRAPGIRTLSHYDESESELQSEINTSKWGVATSATVNTRRHMGSDLIIGLEQVL